MTEPEGGVIPEGQGHGAAEIEPESSPEVNVEPEPEPASSGTYADEALWNSTSESLGAQPELGDTEIPIWIAAYTLTIALIIIGNAIIIAALVRRRKNAPARTCSDVFLLSLTVSRGAVGVFVVPARVTGLFSEAYLGSALCKLCHYAGLISTVSSILSTTAVAVVRYHEVKGSKWVTHRKSVYGVVGLWLVSAVYAIRAPIVYDLIQESLADDIEPTWLCTITSYYRPTTTNLLFTDLTFLFVVPVLVIGISYGKMVSRMSDVTTTTTSSNREVFSVSEGKQDKILVVDQDHKQRHVRTMRMVVVVAALFFLCTIGPYILDGYVCNNNYFETFATVQQVVYLWSYANGWINVLLLMYFRSDLNGYARSKFCCF